MNKFLKKRLFRGLVVLLPVLFLGIPKAHAGIPIISNVLGAIGGVLGNVAAGIIEAFASLLKLVVQLLGMLFFYVANTAVQFAMEMNFILPDSQIIKDGFSIVLTVANTALVAGILVIAFAVMTRADWLSEARTALPKFITAALLINFSLFIGLNLIIIPVNSLTRNIYNATGFTQNSFNGPFNVHLNLGPILQTQLAISSAPEPTGKLIEKYFQLKEQLQSDVYDLLLITESEHFRDSLNASALGWNVQLSGLNIVTKSQREGVAGAVASIFYENIQISQTLSGVGSSLTGGDAVASIPTWENLQKAVRIALRAGGAPYLVNDVYKTGLVNDVYKTGYGPENLVDSVMDRIKSTYLNSSFSCDLESGLGCESLENTIESAFRELSSPERIIIALVEVLFEGLFVFLGSFSLLGLASMLFIRYIALSLLLILFPLTWIGWIFPKIAAAGGGKNIWNAWWNQFIRWNIFGPFVTFFFFLAVRGSLILDKITPTTAGLYGGTSSIAVLAASVGNLMTVLGLLIGGMYVANKMGIAGSKLFYGSMMKMRNWAGKQIKKAAKGTLVNKYTKRGWGKIKDTANASQDLLKEQEKRRLFMHKDAKGEWKDNAPYLNSQILEGLMQNPERVSEGALAAAYELLGEGKILPFETPTQQLLARAQNINGFVDRHGLRKAQNNLRKLGYSGRAETATQAGGDRYAVLAGLIEDVGERPVIRFDPDTYHLGAGHSGGAIDDAQQRIKIDAKNDLLTVHRSDQLPQNFAAVGGEQKSDLLAASSAVLEEFDGLVGAALGPGFGGLTTQEQLGHIDALNGADLTQIWNGANPNGSALHRAIRAINVATPEGQMQLRRSLRSILSNNANLVGQASMLGAYIGGVPPTTP
ncbi:MAG: hypothetical protein UX29_C0006G0006 [Parcubacteria group bacterium GW2011_GWA2_46_10]|nr:MAG: hypothetical protein UX29_C0006G0006 [Parcubacteria group bacterium GW2011_GWA2_46_10]